MIVIKNAVFLRGFFCGMPRGGGGFGLVVVRVLAVGMWDAWFLDAGFFGMPGLRSEKLVWLQVRVKVVGSLELSE